MLMLSWFIGVCLLAAVTWAIAAHWLRWQVGSRIGIAATLPILGTWALLIMLYVDWRANDPEASGWRLVMIAFTFIISLVSVLPALATAWAIESRWGHAAP